MKPQNRTVLALLLGLAMTGMLTACTDDGPTGLDAPPAPTELTVTQLSLTSVRASWAASAGATSYLLERASAQNPGVFTQIGGSLAETTYDDNGLTEGMAYSYRVAAVGSGGTSAFSTVATIATGVSQATIEGNITSNRTLSADTVYVLKGFVKVTNGATLTIQPGTRIVGDTTTFGSSLWITRGARIMADGTAEAPIVLTSQRAPGNRKPGDWGGLVIVGNGIINRQGTILTEGPTGVAENYAGGTDNADNSGVLRYVRIEFAGFDVSAGQGSELNGLSMYAVGSGTTLEYVQTIAGLDDSFEWWGGAVDGRYLVSYESGDDHFDWTEGWQGRVQFGIAFQSTRLPPAPGSGGTFSSDPFGIEADGCAGSGCPLGFRSTPLSNPVMANLTIVGAGDDETVAGGGIGMVLRRGTAGVIHNAIVARWHRFGISVRDAVTDTLRQRDSLSVQNILFAGNGSTYEPDGTNFGQAANFAEKNHRIETNVQTVIASVNPAALDWTPISPATTGAGEIPIPASRAENFFGSTMPNTEYFGAVPPGPGPKWYDGWTRYFAN